MNWLTLASGRWALSRWTPHNRARPERLWCRPRRYISGAAAVVAAYLARFKGQPRVHTESDLRGYPTSCGVSAAGSHPLVATADLRSRCTSGGCRRSAVPALDGLPAGLVVALLPLSRDRRRPEHSPADYVRRPHVPAGSPTLGLATSVRGPTHRQDLRRTDPNSRWSRCSGSWDADLRGHREPHRGPGRGARPPGAPSPGQGRQVVLVPLPPAVAGAIERFIDERTAGPILLTSRGTRMDRHCPARRPPNHHAPRPSPQERGPTPAMTFSPPTRPPAPDPISGRADVSAVRTVSWAGQVG